MIGTRLAFAAAALAVTGAIAEAEDAVERRAWDGFYAGVHAGGAVSPFRDEVYDGYYGGTATGLIAGGQIGFNAHVVGGIVAGLEASASWDQIRGPGDEWDVAFAQGWEAALRARLGFDHGRFMPYLAAGVAVTNAWADYGAVESYTVMGLTAGAGVAFMPGERTSAFVEVNHTDFGTRTYGYDLHLTEYAARIGLNVQFRD